MQIHFMYLQSMMKPEILGEKCGIVGVYTSGADAARLAYPALFSLQHRGQEGCGIATANDGLHVRKGMGLIAHVFSEEEDMENLPGFMAIAHTRYSTSRGSTPEHIQPVLPSDKVVALAHNGNLPSTVLLENYLRERGLPVDGSNDSEMITDAIAYGLRRGSPLEEAIADVYPLFTGAFSLVVLTKNKLAALRDPKGIRPLSLGKINGNNFIFASETCALDTVGAEYVCDVLPGEMVVVDASGLNRYQLAPGEQKLDIFELVYFARPDSVLLGKSVYGIRKNFGRILALEAPVSADLVLAVPDSAVPAALGFADELGLPFETGLIKNRYIHRTFIEPHQRLRDRGVQLKLNPIPEIIEGKRVVILDDSIVRGTTIGPIVAMLRKAGAREVHVRISSPPVRYPDFYGIDTPFQNNLIAARKTVSEIREQCGADSLAYLSYKGMIAATNLPEEVFSTSCFTGIYPVDIRERAGEIVRF